MIIYNLHKGNFSLLSGLQIPPNYQREIFPSDRFPPKLRPSPVRAFRFCGHKNTTCYSLFIVEATPVRIGGRCASFPWPWPLRFLFPYCCPIWKGKSLQRASFVAAAVSDGEGSLNTWSVTSNLKNWGFSFRLWPWGYRKGSLCLRWRGEPQHLERYLKSGKMPIYFPEPLPFWLSSSP